MSTSELFRHYAQRCTQVAEICGGSNRDLMLGMADRWVKLADLEQQRDEERPPDHLVDLGPTGGVWRRGGFERVSRDFDRVSGWRCPKEVTHDHAER